MFGDLSAEDGQHEWELCPESDMFVCVLCGNERLADS